MNTLDLTHKMVLDPLFMLSYEGTSYSDSTSYYQPMNKAEMLLSIERWVEDHAEECYDLKAFAGMATPAIRDKLDYDLLTKIWEEMSWEMFVWELFPDDDENDKMYWKYFDQVHSRVKCEWAD